MDNQFLERLAAIEQILLMAFGADGSGGSMGKLTARVDAIEGRSTNGWAVTSVICAIVMATCTLYLAFKPQQGEINHANRPAGIAAER